MSPMLWIVVPPIAAGAVIAARARRRPRRTSMPSEHSADRTAELMAFQDFHDIPGVGLEEPYYHRYPREGR